MGRVVLLSASGFRSRRGLSTCTLAPACSPHQIGAAPCAAAAGRQARDEAQPWLQRQRTAGPVPDHQCRKGFWQRRTVYHRHQDVFLLLFHPLHQRLRRRFTSLCALHCVCVCVCVGGGIALARAPLPRWRRSHARSPVRPTRRRLNSTTRIRTDRTYLPPSPCTSLGPCGCCRAAVDQAAHTREGDLLQGKLDARFQLRHVVLSNGVRRGVCGHRGPAACGGPTAAGSSADLWRRTPAECGGGLNCPGAYVCTRRVRAPAKVSPPGARAWAVRNQPRWCTRSRCCPSAMLGVVWEGGASGGARAGDERAPCQTPPTRGTGISLVRD